MKVGDKYRIGSGEEFEILNITHNSVLVICHSSKKGGIIRRDMLETNIKIGLVEIISDDILSDNDCEEFEI